MIDNAGRATRRGVTIHASRLDERARLVYSEMDEMAYIEFPAEVHPAIRSTLLAFAKTQGFVEDIDGDEDDMNIYYHETDTWRTYLAFADGRVDVADMPSLIPTAYGPLSGVMPRVV